MDLLIAILIFLVVAVVVLYLASWILAHLPIDTTLRNIILAIIGLLLLIIFLQRVGALAALGVH